MRLDNLNLLVLVSERRLLDELRLHVLVPRFSKLRLVLLILGHLVHLVPELLGGCRRPVG